MKINLAEHKVEWNHKTEMKMCFEMAGILNQRLWLFATLFKIEFSLMHSERYF